jgi:hypothetical protein
LEISLAVIDDITVDAKPAAALAAFNTEVVFVPRAVVIAFATAEIIESVAFDPKTLDTTLATLLVK